MSAQGDDANKATEEKKTNGDEMVKLELSPPPMKQPILSAREDLLTKYGLFNYYNEFSKPYNGPNPEKTLDPTFFEKVKNLSGKQDFEPDNYLINLVMQPERNVEQIKKYTEREARKAFTLIKEPPVPKEIREYIDYVNEKRGLTIIEHSNNNYPPLPKVHIRPPAQKDSPDELNGEEDRDRSEKKHKKKKKKRKHDKEREEEEEEGSPSSEKKKKKKKKKKSEKYERDSEDE